MAIFVRERWIFIYGWVLITGFGIQSCDGLCANNTESEQLEASPAVQYAILFPHTNTTNCTLNITAPVTDQVNIVLTTLHLRQSDNCTIDRIIIYDGPDDSSKQHSQYCFDSSSGLVEQAAIFSTGQSITVMMQAESYQNFTFLTNIAYTSVPKMPEPCGAGKTATVQLYTANQTVVQRYRLRQPNMNCTLNITSPVNSQVKLRVSAWPVQKLEDCTNDKIIVYDGSDESSKRTLQYCYSTVGYGAETIFSSGQSISVLLQTDLNETTTISGVIYYEAVPLIPACSSSNTTISVNSSTSVTFSGPGDFSYNPANKLCVWKIVAPIGQITKLAFTYNRAYVIKVFDSDKADISNLAGTFSVYHNNYRNGDPIYSTGRYMYVQFEASSPTNIMGTFDARVTAVEPGTVCSPSGNAEQNQNIQLSTSSGNITSPGYPNIVVTSGYKCRWYITVPEGKVVKLNIRSLFLDSWLSVYGGNYVSGYSGKYYSYNRPSPSSNRLILRSYRPQNPSVLVTQSRHATVLLDIVRKNANTKGLWIEYSPVTVVSSNSCKANATATIQIPNENEGVIISPNYPSNTPKNMTCQWNITVPEGHVVKLTFQKFSDDCKSNRVKLFDGMSAKSPLISCSSGHIYSQSRHLLVEFTTNSSRGDGNILAIFAAVKSAPSSCSANKPIWVLTDSNGTLASYNYPEPYPNNALCTWTIKAPQHQVIKLTFQKFSLQASDKCEKDYLQVRSTKYTFFEKLGTYCGSTKPAPIIGVRNEMYLWFESDWASNSAGFVATYEAINDTSWRDCSSEEVELTKATGSVYSPRYPNPFPSQVTCFWKITASPERHIRLAIRHFELTSSSKLTISEGPSLNDSLIGTYSSSIPPVFYSKGQQFFVRFTSNFSSINYYKKGFHLTYETTMKTLPYSMACSASERSRRLTDKTGVIASEGFPNNYSDGVNCGFSIDVSGADSITLTFDFFNLEPSPNCSLDHVEVFDGGYASVSPSLGKFCGNNIPSPVTATRYGHMLVKFVSSGSGRYPGFKASYKCKFPMATIYIVLIIVACVLGATALLYLCVYLYKKKMATVNHAPPVTMSSLELVGSSKM